MTRRPMESEVEENWMAYIDWDGERKRGPGN